MRKARITRTGSAPKHNLQPYYVETQDGAASSEWTSEIRRLIGFDIEATRERMHGWFLDRGFARRDGDAIVLALPPEVRVPDEPHEHAKARALYATFVRLMDLEDVYAAERVAAHRWHQALDHLERALEATRVFAAVRVEEEAHFVGRMCGPGARQNGRKRAARATSVVRAIDALARRSRDAKRLIPRYEHDTLAPAGVAWRATAAHRGGLELDLFEAGFSHGEIAALFLDGNDSRGAAERARKRIADARARRATVTPE
jgi:hypothetical protein